MNVSLGGVFVFPCNESALYMAGLNFFKTTSLAHLRQLLNEEPHDKVRDLCRAALIVNGSHAAFDDDCRTIVSLLGNAGHSLHCRSGCSACCKQAILSNPFEAVLIGFHLAAEPEKLASFQMRYERWDAETKSMRCAFPNWAELMLQDGVDDGSFDHKAFTAHCPFLVDDKCQIYPIRPYGCRSYVAFSESCRNPDTPEQRPGRQGIGAGTLTSFHQDRLKLLGVLWERFGLDASKARGRFLPDQVQLVLAGDVDTLLDQCISPSLV